MEIIPISLKFANDYVAKFHRHNKPVQGHKWSLAISVMNGIIGVGIVGRPIARYLDDGLTLEVLRVCTNGERNANSFLYGRIAKIARLMGYKKIITYTLTKETGASLRAIGAKPVANCKPQEWNCKKRPRKTQDVYKEEKVRWEL